MRGSRLPVPLAHHHRRDELGLGRTQVRRAPRSSERNTGSWASISSTSARRWASDRFSRGKSNATRTSASCACVNASLQRLLPLPFALVEVGIVPGECAVKLVDLRRGSPSSSRDLARRGDLELGLVHVVEEGEEPVVLALGDRVVLVVVALGAADRQAEEDRPGRVDPVDDRIDPELLDVDPPFLVDLACCGETRWRSAGEARRPGRRSPAIWSMRELVERHVGIEGGDDPVAILPDRARGVDVVAVGIGVAGLVEPGPGPPFAEMGRGQQPVDDAVGCLR